MSDHDPQTQVRRLYALTEQLRAEVDAANARLEAVRVLCVEAESTTWAVPMVSTQRLRVALDPEATS